MTRFAAAVATAVLCRPALAASLSVTHAPSGATHAVFLSGDADNGNFDTVFISVVPIAPATFDHITGTGLANNPIRPPLQAFTYRNRVLDLDPLDPDNPGGLGWSVLGSIVNSTKLEFTGGPLGQTISTAGQPGGKLFLANLTMNSAAGNGVATVQLFRAGILVQELSIPLNVPEPCGAVATIVTMAGLTVFGRRTTRQQRTTW